MEAPSCGHDPKNLKPGCTACADLASRRGWFLRPPAELPCVDPVKEPSRLDATQLLDPPCVYRSGDAVTVPCSCPGRTLESYACSVHGRCTVSSRLIARDPKIKACRFCKQRSTDLDAVKATPPRQRAWAYGVTTVPARKTTTLPRTLTSLAKAGFPQPRLFVDAVKTPLADWSGLGYEVTFRQAEEGHPLANWWLSLHELYARNHSADYYALFQDDVVFVRNLRQYLELAPWPGPGYLNLYTFPANRRAPRARQGFYPAAGRGLGALALVFDRASLKAMLLSEHLFEKFVPKQKDPWRAHKAIDGGVWQAARNAGMTEWVHLPSLCQHTGHWASTIGHSNKNELADSFPGEQFDAADLLK